MAGLTWQQLLVVVRNSVLNPAIWDSVSPELYATFWTLSLPDIFVPVKR